MEEYKDKYIRFDWAIKRLLRQKANFDVLEGFLTVFLNQPIKIVEILESESNQEDKDDKFNRVDIKALNKDGEIIIIEIQNTREVNFLERILYGVAKAITEHISLGETYDKVKKVYSISVLYFDLGQGSDYLYVGQNHFVGVHTHDDLKINIKERDALAMKSPSAIFPEYILIRVNEFNKVAVTPLEEWMQYLKDGVIRHDTHAPGLIQARKKLLYYSMSPKERQAYDRHIDTIMIQNDVIGTAHAEGLAEGKALGIKEGKAMGIEEGKAMGIEEGKAMGIEEERIRAYDEKTKMVQNMKADGIPVEIIAKYTGLSAEEIEKI